MHAAARFCRCQCNLSPALTALAKARTWVLNASSFSTKDSRSHFITDSCRKAHTTKAEAQGLVCVKRVEAKSLLTPGATMQALPRPCAAPPCCTQLYMPSVHVTTNQPPTSKRQGPCLHHSTLPTCSLSRFSSSNLAALYSSISLSCSFSSVMVSSSDWHAASADCSRSAASAKVRSSEETCSQARRQQCRCGWVQGLQKRFVESCDSRYNKDGVSRWHFSCNKGGLKGDGRLY